MKNISEGFLNSLKDSTINLIKCWKISLIDGRILAFTTNDENIFYDGLEYIANSSDEITNIKTNVDIQEDSLNIENIVSSNLISSKDILLGKYSNAEIEVFLLNNLNIGDGKIVLLKGKISNIEYKDNLFIAKIIGLKNELNKEIGDIYSPLCRTKFCDIKCKLIKNNFIFNGTVHSIQSNKQFSTKTTEIINKISGYFEYGVIEFTSGENIGEKVEVKQFENGNFILSIDLPYTLNINDEFIVTAGCDKTFKCCCNKFSNAINFRGEPHLPGIDILLKIM